MKRLLQIKLIKILNLIRLICKIRLIRGFFNAYLLLFNENTEGYR